MSSKYSKGIGAHINATLSRDNIRVGGSALISKYGTRRTVPSASGSGGSDVI